MPGLTLAFFAQRHMFVLDRYLSRLLKRLRYRHTTFPVFMPALNATVQFFRAAIQSGCE
jgi:endonuclease III-like uncharacterized protein